MRILSHSNSAFSFSHPPILKKGSALKGKNLLLRSKFFLLRVDPSWEGLPRKQQGIMNPEAVSYHKKWQVNMEEKLIQF